MKQALSILILLAACGPKKGPVSPAAVAGAPPPSGGGKPAITAVVDEFVTRNVTDPRVKFRFFNTDAARLKTLLVEFVCLATGGPCKYTGRDMKTSHTGMKITEAEWNATVEDLVKTLDKYKVPKREKNDLLALLGSLKADIVGI